MGTQITQNSFWIFDLYLVNEEKITQAMYKI